MKTNNLLYLLAGIIIGIVIGGFTTMNSWRTRIDRQTQATIAFIELLDECDSTLMDDVIVETDEWDELSKYIEY